MISVDTETTGLGREAKLCGLCLAWEAGAGVYVPVRSPKPGKHLDEATVLAVLGPVLSDHSVPKCGHNLKFDLRVLTRAGIETHGAGAIAVTVLTSVIGRRPGRILVDAGGLALSKDRSTEATRHDYGYGLALDIDGRRGLGNAIVRKAYQEHGVIELDPAIGILGRHVLALDDALASGPLL